MPWCKILFDISQLIIIQDPKFSVGEHNLRYKSKYEEVIAIEKVVIHSGYNADSQDNDIALLKLKSPILYNA